MTEQALGPRAHGGTRRSGLQTGLFAGLVASGLWLWLRPADGLVVFAHVGAGLVLAVLIGTWLMRHVPKGLGRSERAVFTQSSWALLASWLVLIGTGMAMAVPGALWLAGVVWFPDAAVTGFLSFAHLWVSFLAAGGLVLHLGLRHWGAR